MIVSSNQIQKAKLNLSSNECKLKRIERIGSNGWETIWEEKKELLTEEEKEFLKRFIKIRRDKILAIKRDEADLEISGKAWDNSIPTDEFKGLETHKLYTLKELGLEEK